jgi:protein TonB
MPKYPTLARQQGKEAVVVLRMTIDERGRQVAVETLKPAGSGFDEEAIRAVKDSLFHPAKWEGKPVICRAVLPIRFELRGAE